MNKILIVDDDALLQKMYQSRFMSGGFTVITAGDGEAGFQLALQEHPDLILLDVDMPKMDGVTMLQQVRLDAWGKTVPIIMLTNLDTDDAILKGIVANKPSYYLLKDQVSPEEVFEKVNEILDAS
jgi:DNA-binding response OmpR family regulator